MTTQTYRLIVGEVGNAIGHIVTTRATSFRGAKIALGLALRPYAGAGWGRVEFRRLNGEWERLEVDRAV